MQFNAFWDAKIKGFTTLLVCLFIFCRVLTLICYIKVDFTFRLQDNVHYNEEFVISRFYSIQFISLQLAISRTSLNRGSSVKPCENQKQCESKAKNVFRRITHLIPLLLSFSMLATKTMWHPISHSQEHYGPGPKKVLPQCHPFLKFCLITLPSTVECRFFQTLDFSKLLITQTSHFFFLVRHFIFTCNYLITWNFGDTNLVNLAIFLKTAKLKCNKIKCR